MRLTVITDTATLQARIDRLRNTARARRQRALLLLCAQSAVDQASLCRWLTRQRTLYELHAGSLAIDSSDRLRAVLGTEHEDLFWSAPASVRASEVAAVLGTLRAGHLAIVRLPTLARQRSTLLRRLQQGACASQRPIDSSTGSATGSATESPLVECAWLAPALERRLSASRRPDPVRVALQRRARAGRFVDQASLQRQDAALGDALDALRRDERACVVIVGRRGSGKSRLLGRIANALMSASAASPGSLGATGASPRTVRLLGATKQAAHSLLTEAPSVPQGATQAVLDQSGLTLLIDEAASLPLATLNELLRRHGRAVLATTVDGYESAGRAFAGRFLDELEQRRPGWRRIDTVDSFRAAPDDALGAVLDRALYLDAFVSPRTTERSGTGTPAIERLTTRTLQRSERLTRRVVALLAQTHYRAAIDDLDALLRGEPATVVARDGQHVVGVAIVAREGRMPGSLAEPVLAGRRRLPDQLLAQRLARCANDASAIGEHYLRITRIAVTPERRREGIARRLVESVARQAGADVAIGASYARAEGADRFWASLGGQIFHDGHRINPRSGERSRAVLIGGSHRTRAVLERAVAIRADNLHPARAEQRDDSALLRRFADGQRALADCRGALSRAWQRAFPDGVPFEASRAALALPADANERRWERALTLWVGRQLLPVIDELD